MRPIVRKVFTVILKENGEHLVSAPVATLSSMRRQAPNFRLDLQAGLLRETAKNVDQTRAGYVGIGGDHD